MTKFAPGDRITHVAHGLGTVLDDMAMHILTDSSSVLVEFDNRTDYDDVAEVSAHLCTLVKETNHDT